MPLSPAAGSCCLASLFHSYSVLCKSWWVALGKHFPRQLLMSWETIRLAFFIHALFKEAGNPFSWHFSVTLCSEVNLHFTSESLGGLGLARMFPGSLSWRAWVFFLMVPMCSTISTFAAWSFCILYLHGLLSLQNCPFSVSCCSSQYRAD